MIKILFLFLIIVLLLVIAKYFNYNNDNEYFSSNSNSNSKKLIIIVHPEIKNIDYFINLCKLYYGEKCKLCINDENCKYKIIVITKDLFKNHKINLNNSYIILHNGNKKDDFYKKTVLNNKTKDKLVVDYNSKKDMLKNNLLKNSENIQKYLKKFNSFL